MNWIQRLLLSPVVLLLLVSIQNCTAAGERSTSSSSTSVSKVEGVEGGGEAPVVGEGGAGSEGNEGNPASGGEGNSSSSSGSAGSSTTGGEGGSSAGNGGGDESEASLILGVIDRNPACDSELPVTDMGGKDYRFNGVQNQIAIGNAGNVSVNGMTQVLNVQTSESVQINGVHAQVCLNSNHFLLNGVYGQSGIPTVLMGEGPDAQVSVVNGVQGSDLALITVQSIGTINGTGGDIYIYGGTVGVINGVARNVYLMNNAEVKLMNGQFQNVYLYDGSMVDKSNGIMNLSHRQ